MPEKKNRFFNEFSDYSRGEGLRTILAIADAYLLISLTVVECSKTLDTVVIGDDADFSVLLLHHCDPEHHELYFH